MPFGGHSHVCVSDEYELGFQFALPFAGFFSCNSGNPLAVPRSKPQGDKKTQGKNVKRVPSVEVFLEGDSAGTFKGPQSCPRGYTQHLLAVDNECEINYCVKANSLARLTSTVLKRPPYSPRPGVSPNATKTLMVVGVNGSLLRRGLLQSRWVETRGGWEEGKLKARRERLFPLPIVPRAPVFSLKRSRFPSFFFHWCLLPGAFAEERG